EPDLRGRGAVSLSETVMVRGSCSNATRSSRTSANSSYKRACAPFRIKSSRFNSANAASCSHPPRIGPVEQLLNVEMQGVGLDEDDARERHGDRVQQDAVLKLARLIRDARL